MNWFDKLLMKLAIAKTTARSGLHPEYAVDRLINAFAKINEASACTSPSGDPEGPQ